MFNATSSDSAQRMHNRCVCVFLLDESPEEQRMLTAAARCTTLAARSGAGRYELIAVM
jgi:hypothetical protein